MKSRSRGCSPRLLLGLVVFLGACTSRVDPTGTGVGAVSTEPPLGCEKTVCQLAREQCENPCAECWKLCGNEDSLNGVRTCASACGQICTLAKERKDTLLAECAEAFDRCQSTHENAICVDHVGEPVPAGSPPCSHDRVIASCACGSDSVCLGVLDAADEACRRCNRQWTKECIETACGAEHERMIACASENRCADVAQCAPCAETVEALAKCVDAAEDDPRDVGGCFSGMRSCWAETACPAP